MHLQDIMLTLCHWAGYPVPVLLFLPFKPSFYHGQEGIFTFDLVIMTYQLHRNQNIMHSPFIEILSALFLDFIPRSRILKLKHSQI